ncbi:MAG: cell division protein ZapA [Pseudomonadota bacterium]
MAKADIQVYGRAYTVACAPGQEQRLGELGRELDDRLRKIAAAVGDVGEDRLLLVASLSLLDELHAARGSSGASAGDIEARASSIIETAVDRIEAIVERAEARLRGQPANL